MTQPVLVNWEVLIDINDATRNSFDPVLPDQVGACRLTDLVTGTSAVPGSLSNPVVTPDADWGAPNISTAPGPKISTTYGELLTERPRDSVFVTSGQTIRFNNFCNDAVGTDFRLAGAFLGTVAVTAEEAIQVPDADSRCEAPENVIRYLPRFVGDPSRVHPVPFSLLTNYVADAACGVNCSFRPSADTALRIDPLTRQERPDGTFGPAAPWPDGSFRPDRFEPRMMIVDEARTLIRPLTYDSSEGVLRWQTSIEQNDDSACWQENFSPSVLVEGIRVYHRTTAGGPERQALSVPEGAEINVSDGTESATCPLSLDDDRHLSNLLTCFSATPTYLTEQLRNGVGQLPLTWSVAIDEAPPAGRESVIEFRVIAVSDGSALLAEPASSDFSLTADESFEILVTAAPTRLGEFKSAIEIEAIDHLGKTLAPIKLFISQMGDQGPMAAQLPYRLNFTRRTESRGTRRLRAILVNPGNFDLERSEFRIEGRDPQYFQLNGQLSANLTIPPGSSEILDLSFHPSCQPPLNPNDRRRAELVVETNAGEVRWPLSGPDRLMVGPCDP